MYTSAAGQTDLRTSEATAWVGWIIFAAMMMIISGTFSIIWGIVALVRDQVFVVGRQGNVINLDYTAWGWIELIIGAIVLLTGIFLFRGNLAASIVAVILAGLSAIANLLVIAAYPVWSVIVIAVDVLVIYAITVHGNELRDN
jgi:hypothetical protein